MGKQDNISADARFVGERIGHGLENLANAIREHTAHVREDDQRYWDEKNADAKDEGTTEDRTVNVNFESAHPTTHDSDTVYDDALRTMRGYSQYATISRARRERLMPPHLRSFPDFVVEFMQTTPHAFRRQWRSRMIYGPPAPCRVCELSQDNPVHQVLLPEFHKTYTEDD